MKILVTGDREWDNLPVVIAALSKYPKDTIVIHGNCRGADLTAEVVAQELGMTTIPCPAHWRHNTREWVRLYGPCPPDCPEVCGRPAGVLRNGAMLTKYHPERVLAFHNALTRSTGTLDMIKRARKAGLDVDLYDYTGLVGTNPPTAKSKLVTFLATPRHTPVFEMFFE